MIRNQASAKRIVEAALEASGSLDRALAEARPELSEEEFLALREAVGKAMGEIYCEILRPVWKQHPILEPKE